MTWWKSSQRPLLSLSFGAALAVAGWHDSMFAQNAPPPEEESPLFVQATTADEQFDQVLLLANLARVNLAKAQLERLLEANPTAEELLQLRAKHGTNTFLELTRVPELEAPAQELLRRLAAAVREQAQTPGYVSSILPRLQGPARQRAEALQELRHLGAQAVPAILRDLDNTQGVDVATLEFALLQLGPDAIPPLIAATQAPSPNQRATALRVLGMLGGPDELQWLWRPALSGEEPAVSQRAAQQTLARKLVGDDAAVDRLPTTNVGRKLLAAALTHLKGQHAWPELYADQTIIPVWSWSPETDGLVEHRVSREQASLYYAERLARDAAAVNPGLEDAAIVVLAARLTRDLEARGWRQGVPTGPGTAHDLALEAGPEACERVLRLALDLGLPGASLGALQALSLNGSSQLLRGSRGESAVIAALDAPSRRVQFAAAVTILHWEPDFAFRGSARVVEILARALKSDTRAASVVIDPNVSRATVTAALFNELGYSATIAATGQEGFALAASHGNVEIAVLHPQVIRWDLSSTLANLRADARTASLPVVIYGPPGVADQLQGVLREFPDVRYVNEGNSAFDLQRDVRPLLAQLSPPQLTQEERASQMTTAAFWLHRLAISARSNVFDLAPAEDALIEAVNHPSVAEDALLALGGVGRPSVQNEYLRVISSAHLAASVRRLAALQLAYHIQRYGQLLRSADVRTLAGLLRDESDPAVRSALASVVGSLKPSPAAAGQMILSSPQSIAPLGPVAKPGDDL